MQYIISTDLDGTLLDHHDYQWHAAQDAIDLCTDHGVPIVFNTSKTFSEVKHLQSEIGINGPVIVENGSALILPDKFLGSSLDIDYLATINLNGISIDNSGNSRQIIFGQQRAEILDFIKQIRLQKGWRFEGFNDWTVAQIAQQTGLSKSAATAATDKYFSEPFVWNDSDLALKSFTEHAFEQGLKVLRGGRFYHLQGNTNKALPIMWLAQHILPLYGANCISSDVTSGKNQPKLICLGDNQNDVDMLNVADYPVCVRSPIADFPDLSTNKKIIYTQDEGPIGWNQAIQALLKK